MNKNNSKTGLRILVVVLSLSLIWCLVTGLNKKVKIDENTKTTIDSLHYVIDSLHAENYPCQIELNRYQMAYKIFLNRNPNAAQQYGDIISNETE
jgi:hypothetical protein